MASPRTRTKQVYCRVSEAEYQELKAIQAAIGQTYRFFLLLGARHARTIYNAEQRRQEGPHSD